MRRLALMSIIVLAMVGCDEPGVVGSSVSSSPSATTSTTLPSAATTTRAIVLTTHTLAPSYSSVGPWSTETGVPAGIRDDLRAALGGGWVLVPGDLAPVDGPTTTEVAVLVPFGASASLELTTVVRPAGSGDVVLSLASFESPGATCASRMPDAAPIDVRGLPGCALLVDDGVDFLEWTEEGRRFHAEFDGIALERVLEWLSGWVRVS